MGKDTVTKAPEQILVDPSVKTIMCDGGGGALGHPAVYYSFDGTDMITCGYCDREFIKEKKKK